MAERSPIGVVRDAFPTDPSQKKIGHRGAPKRPSIFGSHSGKHIDSTRPKSPQTSSGPRERLLHLVGLDTAKGKHRFNPRSSLDSKDQISHTSMPRFMPHKVGLEVKAEESDVLNAVPVTSHTTQRERLTKHNARYTLQSLREEEIKQVEQDESLFGCAIRTVQSVLGAEASPEEKKQRFDSVRDLKRWTEARIDNFENLVEDDIRMTREFFENLRYHETGLGEAMRQHIIS